MNKKIPHLVTLTLLALALTSCGASDSADAGSEQAKQTTQKPARKKAAATDGNTAVTSVATSNASGQPNMAFINTLPVGFVIRGTCEMGTCDWLKVLKVERGGIDAEPKYNFDFQRGESMHSSDYPANANGVQITWKSDKPKGVVVCSREHPYASVGGQGDDLKLSPAGIVGAMQIPANTYFAACHGESGDDGKLAAKYGYDLK